MKKFIITTIAALAISLPTLSAAQAEGNVMYKMAVEGMFCASCSARSKKALQKIDGVQSVDVVVKNGGVSTVSVCAAPKTSFSDAQLKKLFLTKGFSFKSFKKTGSC